MIRHRRPRLTGPSGVGARAVTLMAAIILDGKRTKRETADRPVPTSQLSRKRARRGRLRKDRTARECRLSVASAKYGNHLKRSTRRPRAENYRGLFRGVELLSSANSTIIPLVGGILEWRSPWTPIPRRL